MVSTVVHVSVAILICCALLPDDVFSLKSLLIAVTPVALLDVDAFFFVVSEGLHRSLFHNILLPTVVIIIILYDSLLREDSYISKFLNPSHVATVAAVSYISVMFAGIGLDFSDTGVNIFWPLHDQFYTLEGKLVISSSDGLVQTFVEEPVKNVFERTNDTRTTESFVYRTPANPNPGSPDPAERIFPIARDGWRIVLIGISIVVVPVKLLIRRFGQ